MIKWQCLPTQENSIYSVPVPNSGRHPLPNHRPYQKTRYFTCQWTSSTLSCQPILFLVMPSLSPCPNLQLRERPSTRPEVIPVTRTQGRLLACRPSFTFSVLPNTFPNLSSCILHLAPTSNLGGEFPLDQRPWRPVRTPYMLPIHKTPPITWHLSHTIHNSSSPPCFHVPCPA